MVGKLTHILFILLVSRTSFSLKIFEFNLLPEGNISCASSECKVTTYENNLLKPFVFCGSFKTSSPREAIKKSSKFLTLSDIMKVSLQGVRCAEEHRN